MMEEAFDSELFRTRAHEAVDRLADAFAQGQAGDVPVRSGESPERAFERWDHYQGDDFVNDVIEQAFRVHHPRNLGHQVGPVLPEVAVMDLVGCFLDTGSGIFEVGNPSIPMERVVMMDLVKRFGLPSGAGGVLTSGGSLGNLTALLAMRQKMTESWDSGSHECRYAVLVSEEAHYCVSRAVKMMGWGDEGVITVSVDGEYRMRADAAREALVSARARGMQVLGLIGSAGSTATGRIDPLDELADLCEHEGLWFHVDAAHSGAFVFSKKMSPLLKGIGRADSIVVDFHKMLLSSGLLTAVLFKKEDDSYQTFAQKADYLWSKEETREWWDLAKRTLECTRPMLGLRAYTALRAGREGLFEEYIDHMMARTREFASIVQDAADFELFLKPESNILCYRYVPEKVESGLLNELNEKVRSEVIKGGEFYLVQMEKHQQVYLRSTIISPYVTGEVFQSLLENIRNVGARLITSFCD